jgi:hypothetical protein
VFESGCNLKEIGNWAFRGSHLRSIRIPVNVEKIGEYCFYQCGSFDEIVFESGCNLKEIGNQAFSGSGLKAIEIPPCCEVLTGLSLADVEFVTISEKNKSFIVEDNFVVEIGGETLIRYFGKCERVLIGKTVERISDGCFYKCKSLCEVVFDIGSGLKEIEKYAFSYSGLKSIRIPASVEKIGEGCFSYCKSLCEIAFMGRPVMAGRGPVLDPGGSSDLLSVSVPYGMDVATLGLPNKCQIRYSAAPEIL